MTLAVIVLLGFVLGLAFNVFALTALSIVIGFACAIAYASFGVGPATAWATLQVAALQFGYVFGVLAAARRLDRETRLGGKDVGANAR
jgi:hypothetical protein